MEVVLLGTGAADGWPNPWCTCASCQWARATPGARRGQTTALVDRTLLVDSGGVRHTHDDLTSVRTLLLTHAHPDHADPQPLLWRQWAASEPLEIAGPRAALAACRDWAGPDVTWLPLEAGDEATLASGHRVRGFPAQHDPAVGPPLLYDIDGRLLILWDTAPPLPTIGGRAREVVLLECTSGDGPDLPGHHGFTAFAHTIARLRRDGAIDDDTTVVPVHLGHRNPHGDELARRFAAIGATVLADGATVGAPAPRPSGPRRVLITGGARSGKSLEAERRVSGEPHVTYVATGIGHDDEPSWADRVATHRARRPAHWETVETTDVAGVLAKADAEDTVLVDCVTLWLTAHLDDLRYPELADALVGAWRTTRATVVMVTNEIGSGVHAPTEVGLRFTDELGRLNARLAAEADEVWLVVAGSPLRLR